MKPDLHSKISAAMIILVSLLAFGMSALGQVENTTASSRSANRRCSNRTLSGDYGTIIEGTILGPNLPLRTISMAHYDGNGNLTSQDYVVLNGMPPAEEWRPASGTYTVNFDCTGTATIETAPGAPPITIHFVVVNRGREIRAVTDGSVITLTARRVD
jgi:hypothetical protein